MIEEGLANGLSRRRLLAVAAACTGATLGLSRPAFADPDGDDLRLIQQLTLTMPTLSDRVRLVMPKSFPNGYTVPMALWVESPMTALDHVAFVRVIAPRNPIVEVATFYFSPGGSQPRVSTRIRLAEPQFVLAAAGMNDGTVLMAKTWVDVASDGCK